MLKNEEIAAKYDAEEFEQMAEELGLGSVSDLTKLQVVEAFIQDLEENGVPEEEDCSDELWNFLVDAGYFQEPDAEEEPDTAEIPAEELPHCYTCADDRDPACRRCHVFNQCMTERKKIRESELPCFGKLYDRNARECQACIEAGPCRIIVLGE